MAACPPPAGRARLRKRAASRRRGGGAERRARRALRSPWRRPLRVSPDGRGPRAAGGGERAGARARGLYVNGGGGGGRGGGSGPRAGRARPGGRSRLSGVDGDDFAAAAAHQHHPIQVLGEDLEELHV